MKKRRKQSQMNGKTEKTQDTNQMSYSYKRPYGSERNWINETYMYFDHWVKNNHNFNVENEPMIFICMCVHEKVKYNK